jgi:hypothetical protein
MLPIYIEALFGIQIVEEPEEVKALVMILVFTVRYQTMLGRDSSVGIATCYWLNGPGIEFRWGRDFLHTSRPVLGPIQPPIQWVLDLFRG